MKLATFGILGSLLLAGATAAAAQPAQPALDGWNDYVRCQIEVSTLHKDNNSSLDLHYYPGPGDDNWLNIPLTRESPNHSTGHVKLAIGNNETVLLDLAANSWPMSDGNSLVDLIATETILGQGPNGGMRVIRVDDAPTGNPLSNDPERILVENLQENPYLREVELNQYMPAHGGQRVKFLDDLVDAGLVPAGTDAVYDLTCMFQSKKDHD